MQEQSETTTLPVISTAENGSGTAETTATYYNIFGQPTWTMDADGTIDYAAYDPATGAVVKTITDVNTQDTGDFSGLPAGWTTPAGGGLELITTMQVDALGRTVEETDPDGNVTCTVYNDAAHEVRTYPGWNSTTHTTTGPIEVQREYWPEAGAPAGEQTMYEETLTSSATPTYNATTNLPTGQETIDQTNIQSLARSLLDDAGQVVEADRYFSLTGVTYSHCVALPGNGQRRYGQRELLCHALRVRRRGPLRPRPRPQLAISRTRFTTPWAGSPASWWGPMIRRGPRTWSTSRTTCTTTAAWATAILPRPRSIRARASPTARRNTLTIGKTGRLPAQSGNYGSTTGPISYQVLDNLGEVVEQETFAGDGVTLAELGATDGVPNPPSSDALCAQTTTRV